MGTYYIDIPNLYVDQEEIDRFLEDKTGWTEVTPEIEKHGYVQYYKKWEPEWLVKQLLPIWSYMGVLVAARAGERLIPHVDTGRSAGILIPCTKSYEENTLDFWDIPNHEWRVGKQQKFHEHSQGTIIESVKYTNPILFKNIPHGVDNTKSKYDRTNLSICFLEPYSYEVLKDLHERKLLVKS